MQIIIQFLRFIGISGIGYLIDFMTFTLLQHTLQNVGLCNIISSLTAVLFVFTFSTRKTFVANAGGLNLRVKFGLYMLYQLVLIFLISQLLVQINLKLLALLANTVLVAFAAVISKIIITPITMTLNFFVMKLLIERL